jgi:CubicO group peptidase (beta-lactamase class C family)
LKIVKARIKQQRNHVSHFDSLPAICQVREEMVHVSAVYSTITSLSGTGRDYPPLDIGEWPQNTPIPSLRKLRLGDLPPPDRSYKQLLDSINKYPLINLPYGYPIYSNSGIDLLGLANVAANKLTNATSETQPQSHEELLQRDILRPLGLNHSFYQPPREDFILGDIAVPKESPEWAVSIDSHFLTQKRSSPAGFCFR